MGFVLLVEGAKLYLRSKEREFFFAVFELGFRFFFVLGFEFDF